MPDVQKYSAERADLAEGRLIYWSALDSWTASEGAAIALDVDPTFAKWNQIKNIPESDSFASKFRDIRRLLIRSASVADDPCPRNICRFLNKRKVPIKESTMSIVKKYGIKPKSQLDTNNKIKINKLENELKYLKKLDNTVRNRNMSTLIGYLAIVHARINPDKNNPIGKQVDSDLTGFDVHMSDDTVRGILKTSFSRLNMEDGLVDYLIEMARKK